LGVPALGEDEALHGAGGANVQQGKVVLEDIDLTAKEDDQAEKWASTIASVIFPGDTVAQEDLRGRFLILPDTVFSFLAETATEIRARIAINSETGTVKPGALWYEENLPAESVLWGVFALSDSRVKGEVLKASELATKLPAEKLLQLGGKAGVGRGLTRFLSGNSPCAQ
jgi:CRISPR-associated protein Cmr4